MDGEILHSGFDALKFTLQTDIPPELRAELASAKEQAKQTYGDCLIDFGAVTLSVTNKGARGLVARTYSAGSSTTCQNSFERLNVWLYVLNNCSFT